MEADALTDAVVSHAMATGWFERVNAHEPKNTPGYGLTAACWVQSVVPLPQASGLAVTSGRVLFNVRLYSSMVQEPQDFIDPNLLKAADALIGAYSSDFQLDGLVRNVDLLGEFGIPLTAQAGYVQIGQGNGSMFRVMTLEVPLVISDLWSQNA